ncbi:hypothetical protein [Chitinophaga nivalis]|uniref:JmjC domain-containing protein n=1 Tax=Chitinophaga nivalis TaxID=2991709 RepID=A0ABT3ILK7_9BACT|nr:hypothetical protein [Chitinophaga nivalis]MCW3465680.1 hypothetical protein [Chitinophaga nivalis]MCW3484629.1 hypothetical protein [Chitinophaga nivalis]
METLTSTTLKPFSARWWDHFLEATANQTRTTVLKDCISREETALFREYILQIIRELAALRTNRFGYRVFIEGKQLDFHDMKKVYDTPPLEGETLEDWVTRLYGEKKFGMIINLGEKFNLSLSQSIALKVAPLFEKIGFPRDGVNFTLFVGNYDKTPLGIHQDPTGQNVIHFHLGPGGKTMYTWGPKEFPALLRDNKWKREDLDLLIPYSEEFSFEEGDMYFMPEGEYHIGKQTGLSLAITFWQYNHTKEKLIKKLEDAIHTQFVQKSEVVLTPDRNDLDDTSGLDDSLSILTIPDELAKLNYIDLLREAYRDVRYSIHSNGGYRTSAFGKKEKIAFEPEDVIELEQPFKILYKESLDKEKLHVYVRGVKLELNNFENIKQLVDVLNEGEPKTVSELLTILPEDWDAQIGLYILGLIHERHGIRKAN